jgi:hypothetical protein
MKGAAMYSLVDGFREILRLADMKPPELDVPLLTARILEFVAVLDRSPDVPADLIEMMPLEMKKAAIAVSMGAFLEALAK